MSLKINNILPASVPIAAIYSLWCIFSILILKFENAIESYAPPFLFSVPFLVVLFVIVASVQTAIFIIFEEPYLKTTPGLRYLFIVFTILFTVLLIIINRKTHTLNNILFTMGTANLFVFANLIGTWIAVPLTRPAELIPICIVMALSDFMSIKMGPTKHIAESLIVYYKGGMQGPAPIGDFLLIKIAVPGMAALLPVFGVADWIIIAFLAAALLKFKMNDNLFRNNLETMVKNCTLSAYLPVSAIGLVVAVLAAQILNIFLPALPIIVFIFLSFVLIRYPETRNLTKNDWSLIAVFSFIMISVPAIMIYING